MNPDINSPQVLNTNLKAMLTEERWPAYASRIASPKDPFEHSPGAIERFMKDMSEFITDVPSTRWQFRPHNTVRVIKFATNKEYQEYALAWEEYCERCAKINKDAPEGRFRILAEFTIFTRKSEGIRSPFMAAEMQDYVTRGGLAAACACKYVNTIMRCVLELVHVHKVPREQISLIWGGDHNLNTQPISDTEFMRIAGKVQRGELMSRKEQKQVENYLLHKGEKTAEREARLHLIEECKKLGLGPQSRADRQDNIDRYQSGKSLYCFYTFKAGGVGLSLHHCDDLTKNKVRRHEHNGYAYPEDIPLIPTRQRRTILAPVFSAIDAVQALYRVPRVTSLSDTKQEVIFYEKTAEEDMAIILGVKLKCLSKVVAAKEGWEGAIYKRRDADIGRSLTDSATLAIAEEALKEGNEKGSIMANEDDDVEGALDAAVNLDEEDEED